MKTQHFLRSMAALIVGGAAALAQTPDNPHVDMPVFLRDAKAAAAHRVDRVISQEKFLEMAAEKGTVVLDARSADKFAMLHVKGATSLPFTDFSEASLAKVLPDKNARILIYCNNNFDNAPIAMVGKAGGAALNLSTLVSLRTYGYTNVYELGGYIDVKQSKLPFAGTDVK
jgi:rhodanese-related sulfurtransferase